MLIDLIAGARPNFMKVAPIIHALEGRNGEASGPPRAAMAYRLIHTGQHYDRAMSGQFFEELGIPDPDINLGAGSGTQAEQTASIMVGYEKVLLERKPDLCLVVGDVTSTMACAIVAKKMEVKVAHVEGGIRSGDWSMPEEVNRVVTDSITDYFFTTSRAANENLRRMGVPEEAIFFVGNTMIDTLAAHLGRLRQPAVWAQAQLQEKRYFVLTLHRPGNVDDPDKLKQLLARILQGTRGLPVIFPAHPRTKKILESRGIEENSWRRGAADRERESGRANDASSSRSPLVLTEPLGYLEFNYLVSKAKAVLTDSGGITEETTYLGIPCLTLRENTERPETVEIGTNVLVGSEPARIEAALNCLFEGGWKQGAVPELWDGRTAGRIVEVLERLAEGRPPGRLAARS